PLFVPREQLRKLIGGIVTDSRAPGEPKEVDGSALFQIYQAFASEEETQALRQAYADGIGWGDAKQMLFERLDREIAPMRGTYQDLIDHPGRIEDILHAGADRARALATPFIRELRHAVGLRDLRAQATLKTKAKADKSTLASFKQYRETDGRFHFKLVDAQGNLLLQSLGFDAPKDAGQAVKRLQAEGPAALVALQALLAPVADEAAVVAALDQLLAAAAE
ncbi:tryptophan--tRNA ligase, partial [Variovorax sp. HJSM1_2]